jgi:hypothetical protein
MKMSYDSSELIADVKEDIELFGDSFKVFAIFTGQFITEYVDADQPTSEELNVASHEEIEQALQDYRDNIAALTGREFECMSLSELLIKLKKQNSLI